MPTPSSGHCQSKFHTACSRTEAGGSSTVFAHELPTRSVGFDAENRLYLFALTVPRRAVLGLNVVLDGYQDRPFLVLNILREFEDWPVH